MTDPTKQPLPGVSPLASALDAPLGGPAQAPTPAKSVADAAHEVAADYRRRRLRHFVASGIGGTPDAPIIYVYWSRKADADREGSVTTHAGYPMEHRVSGQPRATSDDEQPPPRLPYPQSFADDVAAIRLGTTAATNTLPPPPATATPARTVADELRPWLKGRSDIDFPRAKLKELTDPTYRDGYGDGWEKGWDAAEAEVLSHPALQQPAPVAADGAGHGERRWAVQYPSGDLNQTTWERRETAEFHCAGTAKDARVVPVRVTVLADDAGAAGAEGEATRLREAIKRAGFAVMQTSGAWDIYDVSEQGKAADAKSLAVATENVELSVENGRLRTALRWYADETNWVKTYDSLRDCHTSDAGDENGARARAALAAPVGAAAGRDGEGRAE